jgi:hypothetical protein
MDKRYQVFVSSTFVDLQEERQEVMQALLELDCIPAGMELFPAGNDDQWSLIKKVIDDCDYYLVIVGGRYGSQGPDGLSYTEMEYRYATEQGKPVMAFLHKSPGDLSAKRSEETKDGRDKLQAFRELVQQRICKYWETPGDLGGQVSRSLIKMIKSYPAVGWVKADRLPSVEASHELVRLHRRIEELEQELEQAAVRTPVGVEELSQGKDRVRIRYTAYITRFADEYGMELEDVQQCAADASWDTIVRVLGPVMIAEVSEVTMCDVLNSFLRERYTKDPNLVSIERIEISPRDFQMIKVQLRALGMITRVPGRHDPFGQPYWTLTPYGDSVMTRVSAVRRRDRAVSAPVEESESA